MITLADLAVKLNVADPHAVLILAHHLRATDRIDPTEITESYLAGEDRPWASQVTLSDKAAAAVRDTVAQIAAATWTSRDKLYRLLGAKR